MPKRILLRTVVAAGLLAVPGVAPAQMEPYVLFLIDTSASMAQEGCDPSVAGDVDHAVDCAGVDVTCMQCATWGCDDAMPNDGRLGKAKKITTDAINAHPGATYALARFHQTPATFACKGGGWVGGACLGAPLGMGNNSGDILVEFADGNETNLIEWMDLDDNYSGVPPDTGCTLCAACGGGCDKELRPTGASPVAGSLASARQYLQAVMAADPYAACRSTRSTS